MFKIEILFTFNCFAIISNVDILTSEASLRKMIPWITINVFKAFTASVFEKIITTFFTGIYVPSILYIYEFKWFSYFWSYNKLQMSFVMYAKVLIYTPWKSKGIFWIKINDVMILSFSWQFIKCLITFINVISFLGYTRIESNKNI